MKNCFASVMAAIAMILCLSGVCRAQTTPPQPVPAVPVNWVDSEKAAMEYLSKGESTQFNCGWNNVLAKQGFPSKQEHADFTIKNDQIVYEMIDGVVTCDVSKGDQPLSGIYPPRDGYVRTNFSIWASGQDKDGHPTVYGSSYYQSLKAGQPISIDLRPEASMRLIDRPSGVQNDVPLGIRFLPDANGNVGGGGYYDAQNDRFVVWIQPFQPQAPGWVIVNPRLDQVLATGSTPFLNNQPGTISTASCLGFKTLYGTRAIKFDQWGNCNFQNQQLTGWTNGKGGPVQSITYYGDLNEKPLYVQVGGGILSIVVKDGETGEILDSSIYQNGMSTAQLIPGFGSVTITVTGQVTDQNGFWVNVTTNPPPTPVVGDGGGKG